MSCCAAPMAIGLAQNQASLEHEQLIRDLRGTSKPLEDGSRLYTLSVPSIHCGNCIATIEKQLNTRPGVKSARANLSLRRVSVALDESTSPELVVNTLEGLGYPSYSLGEEITAGVDPEFQLLVRSLAVSGFAASNIMLLSVSVWSGATAATGQMFHFLSAMIAIPAVAYAGRPFFRSALKALRHGRVNMDVPISLAVVLTTLVSLYESFNGTGHAYFDAAVSLLFFLLIGRTLDHLMRTKARDAAGRLAMLAAKGGMVVSDNGEVEYLPLEGIKPGMVLRVAAGERVPVDGTIIDGLSDFDRALVTGESAPARLGKGAGIEAGTLNLTGSIDLRADRMAGDSFLADVMQMMQAAEKGRGQYLRLADRMARLYAPVVHLLALCTFIGWMVFTHGNWHQSITTAVAVLIITCPCALGLAVPVAHVLAAARLFTFGVLMKDGSALERLAQIDAVAFDKTGTLTSNNAEIAFNSIPAGRMSAIAKALAQRSIHPSARALASSLGEQVKLAPTALREVPGCGVEGQMDGQLARLGRVEWVDEIAKPSKTAHVNSGLAFAMQDTPTYVVQLKESLRPGAVELVKAFAQSHIPTEILSGDREGAVAAIAARLGGMRTKAGLRPGDKLEHLKALAKQGRKVLMVGDGLNDAPSLAAAHCSMAPATASETGRMAADFVFTREDMGAVWQTWRVARKTDRVVKQNFALSLTYNAIAVPLAILGLMNPLIAALAMSSSSILVVANSMRLRFTKIASPATDART